MKKGIQIFVAMVCLLTLSVMLLVVNDKIDSIGSFGKDTSDTVDSSDIGGGTDTSDGKTYTVQGVYLFEDNIPNLNTTISESVKFTSNGQQFSIMFYDFNDTGKLYYLSDSSALAVYDTVNNSYGWNFKDDGYQMIDFGSTPQTVSKSFYHWFTSYADIYSPPAGTTLLSGVWTLNNSLTFTNLSTTTYYCDYVSNNFIGNAIELTYSAINKTYSLSYLNETENTSKLVYTVSGIWDSDEYRTIDFGLTPQIVSESLYNWLLVNSRLVEDTDTPQQYTVSGTYTFVDNPTNDGPGYEDVTYTFLGDTYYDFYCSGTDFGGGNDSFYCYDTDEVCDVTLDFGSTPQTVSKEFYDWLISNASHQHVVVNGSAIAATCTEDGFTAGSYCSSCNEVFIARTVIEKLGHTAGEWTTIKAATETETGIRVKTCIRCNVEMSREELPTVQPQQYALSGEWEFNDIIVTPSMNAIDNSLYFTSYARYGSDSNNYLYYTTFKGLRFYKTGAVCYLAYGDDINAVGYLCYAYQDGAWTLEASKIVDFGDTPQVVTAEFYTWFSANAKPVTSSSEAHVHTIVNIPAIAATCTEKGITEGAYCSVCDEVLIARSVVEKLGHTAVTDSAVAATCTTVGKTEGSHCSRCNTVLIAQSEVSALGHTAGEWTELKAATETETGIRVKTCIRCNTEMSREEIPMLVPQEYTVSGTYTFVDNPTNDGPGYEDVTYTFLGDTYYDFYCSGTDFGGGNDSFYSYDTDEVCDVTLDFGSTPQTVSKEFYEWLTANAS